MNLIEALQTTQCPVLHGELVKFINLTAPYAIPTEHCPVCGGHLGTVYVPFQARPFKGNCQVCKLGIQMQHRVAHEGHVLDYTTGRMCEYRMTTPIALVQRDTVLLLREQWGKMGFSMMMLMPHELADWLVEVERIIKKARVQ